MKIAFLIDQGTKGAVGNMGMPGEMGPSGITVCCVVSVSPLTI